jgi:hypothetical protein
MGERVTIEVGWDSYDEDPGWVWRVDPVTDRPATSSTVELAWMPMPDWADDLDEEDFDRLAYRILERYPGAEVLLR